MRSGDPIVLTHDPDEETHWLGKTSPYPDAVSGFPLPCSEEEERKMLDAATLNSLNDIRYGLNIYSKQRNYMWHNRWMDGLNSV